MPEEIIQSESLPPEVFEVMRTVITAIRIIKLYPSNNPVYGQSVDDAHETLTRFLEKTPEYLLGVQKNAFTFQNNPLKDTDANRAIAQDLFTKGIRDIVFRQGVTAKELMDIFQALALQAKELAMQNGVSSILWEKGATHIEVNEAGLDEVTTSQTPLDMDEINRGSAASDVLRKTQSGFGAHSLVLDKLLIDHQGFGAEMLARALEMRGENETIEDRLLALYQEAARKIRLENPDKSEAMFIKLAESAMSLEQPYRNALIAGKLYVSLDQENTEKQQTVEAKQVPNDFQELMTGRYLDVWVAEKVAELLKKISVQEAVTPQSADYDLTASSLLPGIAATAKEAAQYTDIEQALLKSFGSMGTETDVIDFSISTLIALIPVVRSPQHEVPTSREIALFSGVIHQLEDMLNYLLQKKDYERISQINDAFNLPVDPAFKPRMLEALRKTSSRTFITSTITDLQKYEKDSPEYNAVYSYLAAMEKETTEVLLEMLVKESSSKLRAIILELLKNIGKNQISILSDHLSDSNLTFVRDIIHILSESKSDQAITSLQKAAENKNVKVRQEVIRGLIAIGGKRAVAVMGKFLKDEDEAVQLAAIRGFMEVKDIGAEDVKPLVRFLSERGVNKKEHALMLEAIKAVGRTGGMDAEAMLQKYFKISFWKSRKLQVELRDAAKKSVAEINRRSGRVRSAK